MTRSISLLGFGTIGREIAGAVADGTIDSRVTAILDHHPDAATEMVNELFNDPPQIVDSVSALTTRSDVVVEAASGEAIRESATSILETGTDLMILSVGALADPTLDAEIRTAAAATGAVVYVPSGAIAGLDAITAAATAKALDSVSLTTTKPPDGLSGAPYIVSNDIDLDVPEPTTIFEGTAAEAASAFPKNINVAMALSLAGIGPELTRVRIVADPTGSTNIHHIEAMGEAGRIETTVENVPSPANPKTSYLAALSAIACVCGMGTIVRIGT